MSFASSLQTLHCTSEAINYWCIEVYFDISKYTSTLSKIEVYTSTGPDCLDYLWNWMLRFHPDFPDSVLKEIRPERCGPFRQDPNWVFHKILYWKHTLPRNFNKHQSGHSLKPSPFSQCQTQTGPCCCPSNHILWVWQVQTSCCLFTQEKRCTCFRVLTGILTCCWSDSEGTTKKVVLTAQVDQEGTVFWICWYSIFKHSWQS